MKAIVPAVAGLLSVGALIYLYMRRREKDKEDGATPELEPIEDLEFVVKNQQVPAIVGRNSVVLKAIEDKTKTLIRFRESDEYHQICSIKGKRSNVAQAKLLIDAEASKPCVITDEILLPTSSCGKIEGYSGSVLHEICSKSSAKVWVDPGSRKNQADTRRVLITGTEEQVKIAKQLIEDKIKEVPEEKEAEDKKEEFKREPRVVSPYGSTSSITTTDSPREVLLPSPEKFKSNEGQLEVFVSAVNSPSRFWVQLVGPQSTELDFLVDAMTEYYNQKENQELHQIREPYLGQIVAAMLYSDNKWYRAEIVATQVNETLPHELLFDVYFLDYGDSQFISKKDILELRADFLSLRFQAIECFLAHIQPTDNGNKLDEWDEKTVEAFEQMVQAARWKKMISKVVTYKERKSFAFQRQSNKRESSPIPGVELFDPEQNADKNVAVELVKLGFAAMTDPFGDLSKSTILTTTVVDEPEPKVPTVKPEPSAKSGASEAKKEAEKPPAEPQSTKKTRKSPEPVNGATTNGTSPKSTPKKPKTAESNMFAGQKTPKSGGKKQQLSEFLQNEQGGTPKKKPESVDWNALMDE